MVLFDGLGAGLLDRGAQKLVLEPLGLLEGKAAHRLDLGGFLEGGHTPLAKVVEDDAARLSIDVYLEQVADVVVLLLARPHRGPRDLAAFSGLLLDPAFAAVASELVSSHS